MVLTGTRVVRAPGSLWRRIGDGVIVTVAGSEAFDRLTPTGAVVWLLLDRPRTPDEIAERVAQLYGIAVQDVRSDVEALLDDLVARGLAVHAQ